MVSILRWFWFWVYGGCACRVCDCIVDLLCLGVVLLIVAVVLGDFVC